MKAVASAQLQAKIQAHENHRYNLLSLQEMLEMHGFQTMNFKEDLFTMTYVNGTAFFNDYFIGMGFLPSWIALVDEADRPEYFATVEAALNTSAEEKGKLVLTVPIAYLELQVRTE
jgi:arsenite methyltransferase